MIANTRIVQPCYVMALVLIKIKMFPVLVIAVSFLAGTIIIFNLATKATSQVNKYAHKNVGKNSW